MFFNFVDELRAAGIPASFKEHLVLLEALDKEVIEQTPEQFYYLSRAVFVKDEGLLDRFDQVFNKVFKGILTDYGQNPIDIPEDWLKAIAEKFLTPEEMEAIKALGSWEEIMETLKQRLEEQQKRHEGGSKWIGTGGTSPFGNNGYNPEGVRIGGEGGQKRALKVWEKREFANLDNTRELGTRNIKIALRRLRRFAREGNADELDLDATIDGTAKQGWLDIHMRPERHNAVKLLLFLDVGGSMDPFIKLVEELFSAATAEFKNLEFFYFHNCLYEGRVEGQQAALVGPDQHLGHPPQIRPRLQGGVRRRRGDEPLRGHPSRRFGRAFQRGEWLSLAAARRPRLSGDSVDQPGAGKAVVLLAIDQDDPRTDRRLDASADAGWAGWGDARADPQEALMRIRLGQSGDFPAIEQVELSAGTLFEGTHMAWAVGDSTPAEDPGHRS